MDRGTDDNDIGDERPCLRCIKRGLQDACHDGVRKKAKYLHDAPSESLVQGSVVGSSFPYQGRVDHGQQVPSNTGFSGSPSNAIYAHHQVPSSSYTGYPSQAPQGQMPPRVSGSMMAPQGYDTQSPMNQQFDPGSAHLTPSVQSFPTTMHQTIPSIPGQPQSSFGSGPFDSVDLSQYNFDPASFNFGNHYGALEFGMLGQMSSGAAETPPSDITGTFSQVTSPNYATPGAMSSALSDPASNTQPYLFPQEPTLSNWNEFQPEDRHASMPGIYPATTVPQGGSIGAVRHDHPPAFAIGVGASNLASPILTSSPQLTTKAFDGSPLTTTSLPDYPPRPNTQNRISQQQRPLPSSISTPNLRAQNSPSRRARDPSTIYDTVKQPYSYTSGFHGLTALLQKRFSPQKTLRIAKALASIRPSFISCTKTLNRDDLIFMEKCFQRTLWEYEDFINACGTPTIVCRRTGEVAAVGKEFSILTGWKKDVLLGKEPNLNINRGGTSGPPSTGTSSKGGFNTPKVADGTRSELDSSRPQPVFLAELLDDESVIEFYEDFARLAFGDSRGSVTTRCKLLKYKTKDESSTTINGDDDMGNGDGPRTKRRRVETTGGKAASASDSGTYQLGNADGKVECSYCWTVKRDVFDIPMLIVMNVSHTLRSSVWLRLIIMLCSFYPVCDTDIL